MSLRSMPPRLGTYRGFMLYILSEFFEHNHLSRTIYLRHGTDEFVIDENNPTSCITHTPGTMGVDKVFINLVKKN